MKKVLQRWIAFSFLFLASTSLFSHGVLVGYQIGSFPGGNNVRVWIEHWHGAATNVSSFPLQYRINTNTTTGSTITTFATGYVNGQDSTALQNNQSDITFLSGACGGADSYGNWVYWDFNISVCSTNPTQLEILAGTAATTTEGCSSLYPQTIGGINAPQISTSPVTYSCSPTTVDPSTLTNYSVSSLCDPNPDITLSYGGSSWQVGTSPVPTWTINGPSQINITALDKQTQLTSSSSFQVNFQDNTPPSLTAATSQIDVYLDSNGVGLVVDTTGILTQQSDNCAIDTFYFSQTQFDCSDVDPSLVATAFDFNTGSLPAGWNSSPFSVGQPCDSATGNSPDNSNYFWATSNSPAGIRFVETNSLDVSNGGTLDFYIRYGDDDPSFGCEDGDQASEEVYLQYSIDGGNNWVTFYDQWDITGNQEPWYRWYFNSIQIPSAAQTSATKFRWYQPDNSGSSFDNWGLEDVSVSATQLLQTSLLVGDVSGNFSTLSLEVDVHDTIAPTLHFNSDTLIALDNNGQAALTALALDLGSTDNCSIDSLNLGKTTYTCADLGVHNIALVAVDPSGNRKVDSVQVTVVDTIGPEVSAKDLTVYLDSTGLAVITPLQVRQADSVSFSFNSGSWDSEISFDIYSPDGSLLQSYSSVPNTGLFLSDLTASATCPSPCGYKVVGYDSYGDGWNGASIDINVGGVLTNFTFTTGSTDSIIVSPFKTDNCSLDSLFISQSTFDCQDTGTHGVVLNALDQSGNLTQDTSMVTVLDTIAPKISTQPQTLYLDANGFASVTAQDLDAGTQSNCAIDTLIISQGQFFCQDVGSQSIQFTAKDVNGNQASGFLALTVVDTIAPTLQLKSLSVLLGPNGTVSIDSADIDTGSFDNCGIASLQISPSQFDTTDIGSNNVIVTATDLNGNVSQQTIIINVLDTDPPQLFTKDALVYLDSNGVGYLAVTQIDSGSTDNSGSLNLSLSETVFHCGDLGVNTVTLFGSDQSGNLAQKSAQVTVLDTISPEFSRPDTIVAYADNLCRATVNWNNGLTDNCGIASVSETRVSGSIFLVGVHNIVSTASDASGNLAHDTMVVEVRDTVAPTFIGSPTIISTTSAGPNSCGSFVSWTDPSVFDFCAPYTLSSSDSSGSFFSVGTHTVIFTAADDFGNSRKYYFTFVVNDNINPQALPPASVVQGNDSGQCGALVTLPVANGTDNCGVDTAYYDRPNPDFYTVGTHTVTVTVRDSSGNVDHDTFTVTIEDREAPQFTFVPRDTLLGYCNAAYNYTLPSGNDNCSGATVTQIAGVQPGNSFPTGRTFNQFVITDNSGNTDTAGFYVNVASQIFPDLSSISDICSNEGKVDLRFGNTNLNFSGNYIAANLFDPGLAGTGSHPVTYVFTDSLGCQTTGQITVTVVPAPTKPSVIRQGSSYLTTGQYHRYQWLLNGFPIQGATGQSLQVPQSGVYRVRVWSANGCNEYSDPFAFGSVSLVEFGPESIQVYPSPTSGEVNLALPKMKGEHTLTIYDGTGRIILERKLKSGAVNRVDLSPYATGIYQFVIKSSHSDQIIIEPILRKN